MKIKLFTIAVLILLTLTFCTNNKLFELQKQETILKRDFDIALSKPPSYIGAYEEYQAASTALRHNYNMQLDLIHNEDDKERIQIKIKSIDKFDKLEYDYAMKLNHKKI